MGGEIYITKRKFVAGRVVPPRRGRARSSRLDAQIKAKQVENDSLALELQIAQQKLKEAQAEVGRLESAEKGDIAAITIQSAARSRKAKIEVERRKLEIARQQQEIEKRQFALAKKQDGKYNGHHKEDVLN